MTAVEDLAKARARLVETLSGRKPLKLNASPLSNGFQEFAEIVKQNAAARQKLNASKKELVKTLSFGTKQDGFDDGTVVIEIPQDQIVKQAAARSELRQRLAGTYRKQTQCLDDDEDNSIGKRNVTLDSPITPSGTPFVGRYGYITARNGRITLDQLLAEEQDAADEESPSPAVTSGQSGTSDWAPREHKDDFDSEADDEEFDPEQESAAILALFSTPDGQIRKHARKYFLNVNGDGTEASHYAVPLARMNKVSMQPDYDSDAIDEAFEIASGRDSGLANYAAMSRLVRLKQRENMPLNDSQKDHSIRHMASMYSPAPTQAERDNAILKTMGRSK